MATRPMSSPATAIRPPNVLCCGKDMMMISAQLAKLLVAFLLISADCTRTLASASTAIPSLQPIFTCPQGCHCVPHLQTSRWTATCLWDNLDSPTGGQTLAELFAASTSLDALSIQCSNGALFSSYASGYFSGLSSLAHLEVVDCRPAYLELLPNAFDGLAGLKSLTLRQTVKSSGAWRIASGAFNGLSNLEKLHLTELDLRHVPSLEFCSQRELKLLNLSGNHFENMNDIGFDCEQDAPLLILDLSRNDVVTPNVQARVLERLPSLLILNVANNRLERLNFDLFASMQRLQELYIQDNQLHWIQGDIQLSLPSLKQLDLSRNELHVFPPVELRHAGLQMINVSFNFVDSIDIATGLNLPSLQLLDLSRNRLRYVSSGAFENMTTIRHLDLASNQIQVIQPKTFDGLTTLQKLDLSHNQLGSLDGAGFVDLTKLNSLVLANNSITSLSPDFFDGMNTLQSLDLTQNLLLQVPSAIASLYYLQKLDLADNKIAMIQRFLFDKLPNLKWLSLAKNRITSVARYTLESVPNLEWLSLADNAVGEMATNCFHKTAKLREVHIQNNLVTSIDGVFSNLPQLSVLNISDNLLLHVDYSMLPVNLNTLLVGRNRIQRFTNHLQHMRTVNLEKLDMSRNLIDALSLDQIPLTLVEANFSFNRILSMPEDLFARRPQLVSVDLRHNELGILNHSIVQISDRNTTIKRQHVQLWANGNPLQCSCHNAWLKEYDSRQTENVGTLEIADVRLLTCTSLLTGAKTQLTTIPNEDFLCAYETKCTDDCSCCDYDYCDCKNVCPASCECFHDLGFSQNIVRCSRSDAIDFQHLPMFATKIYLDGVQLGELKPHAFMHRFRLKELYLNNSGLTRIHHAAFKGLRSLTMLDLSGNHLTNFSGEELVDVPRLSHMLLANNELTTVGDTLAHRTPELQSVTLHGNKLQLLPAYFLTKESQQLQTVTLGRNEWKCDCNDRFHLQQWLPAHTDIVIDYEEIFCYENLNSTDEHSTVLARIPVPRAADNTVKVNFWTFRDGMDTTFCGLNGHRNNTQNGSSLLGPNLHGTDDDDSLTGSWWGQSLSVVLVVVGVLCTLIIVIGAAAIICGRRISRYYTFRQRSPASDTQYSCNTSFSSHSPPLFAAPVVPASEPLLPRYDVFVLYSETDRELVENELSYKLEMQPPYYNVCLLHRDFPAHASNANHVIADDIIEAMDRSQRVLLILTNAFLQLEWSKAQIRTAVQLVLNKEAKLIAVTIDTDLADLNVGHVLEHYLRLAYDLSWSQPNFWEYLRDKLPDRVGENSLDRTGSDVYQYGSIGERESIVIKHSQLV